MYQFLMILIFQLTYYSIIHILFTILIQNEENEIIFKLMKKFKAECILFQFFNIKSKIVKKTKLNNNI